jgi:hypothetical protein
MKQGNSPTGIVFTTEFVTQSITETLSLPLFATYISLDPGFATIPRGPSPTAIVATTDISQETVDDRTMNSAAVVATANIPISLTSELTDKQ